MNIGLFLDARYQFSGQIRGPQKVANNLINGLDRIGVTATLNEKQELNGCLQSWITGYSQLPVKTLMGPNLFVLPEDKLIGNYVNFVCPSKWVYDKYKTFDNMKNKNLYIWSVGIDTDTFVPSRIGNKCLVYFKHRKQEELDAVVAELASRNIDYIVIKYGDYHERDFVNAINTCSYAVLLTDTESQGIAYMEILSSGLPCYVLNQDVFKHLIFGAILFEAPATSVPYFSEECGIIASDMSRFDEFIHKLNDFCPRDYIVREHSLAVAAQKYIEILTMVHRYL